MSVQYYGKNGWFTGHRTFLPPDPDAYVAGVNQRPGMHCRILDDAGLVLAGDPSTCTVCLGTHDGFDGSCLI